MSEAGRSNKWITQSVIFTLETLKDHPSDKLLVVAQLSSVDRRDLVIDKTSNHFHDKDFVMTDYALIKHMSGPFSARQFKWYSNRLNLDEKYDITRDKGLLSITNIRRDLPESKQNVEKFVGRYVEMFHTDFEQFEITLQNIISLQNYCKLRGINFCFVPWQDIFFDSTQTPYEETKFVGQSYFGYEHPDNVVLDYSKLGQRIDKYPELRYLFEQIDFTNWMFSEIDDCPTGGIADWCLSRNTRDVQYFGRVFAPEQGRRGIDAVHPSDLGYQEFCDQKYLPYLKSKIPAAYLTNETKN